MVIELALRSNVAPVAIFNAVLVLNVLAALICNVPPMTLVAPV